MSYEYKLTFLIDAAAPLPGGITKATVRSIGPLESEESVARRALTFLRRKYGAETIRGVTQLGALVSAEA